MTNNGMVFYFVPSQDHRINIAEETVQTLKNLFVVVLYGTAEHSQMKLCCQSICLAEHQLNIVRKSRAVSSVSAYAHMYRQHDYDANLWAAFDRTVDMHGMPKQWRSFDTHTKSGSKLVIGRNTTDVTRFGSHTRGVGVGQKVFFYHRYLTQSTITTSNTVL